MSTKQYLSGTIHAAAKISKPVLALHNTIGGEVKRCVGESGRERGRERKSASPTYSLLHLSSGRREICTLILLGRRGMGFWRPLFILRFGFIFLPGSSFDCAQQLCLRVFVAAAAVVVRRMRVLRCCWHCWWYWWCLIWFGIVDDVGVGSVEGYGSDSGGGASGGGVPDIEFGMRLVLVVVILVVKMVLVMMVLRRSGDGASGGP